MRIKNRKVALRRIYVPFGNGSIRCIHVTDKQLARLNRIPVGREICLSNFYCQIGGDFSVIRSNDGLQYLPNRYCRSQEDIWILESMLQS
jgi:hypothetical protein